MWQRFLATLRTLPKWQLAVLAIFLGVIFLTLFGPELAPYSTTNASPNDRLLPPSAGHWFGTDDNGIDLLSRVIAAPQTDVVIAVFATIISVVLGAPLGVAVALMESRRGGATTALAEFLMRMLEVIQAFPVFVFAMVLVVIFGGTKLNIIAAIAFVNTPVFVRLVRSEVLSLVQRPFAEAARAVGNSEIRVGFRHILPNTTPTLVVQVSVTIGFAILLTAGLSFVGAGVRPPTPELGSMIASGAKFLIINQWWPALFPGIALGLVVFSFGIFGEVLNKVMEPRALRVAPRQPNFTSAKAAMSDAQPRSNTKVPGAILTVENLDVISSNGHSDRLLKDISFSLAAGESMAIVGESGAGKSILAKTLLGLLPPQLMVSRGRIQFGDLDLLGIGAQDMRALRSTQIAATLTNAKSQLHPMTTVGAMLESALHAHEKISHAEARYRSVELLGKVGMSDPERRLDAYPHELSGGMAQRVCLALALMYKPRLLIADEPTAGLDVTIQRQVLDLMRKLIRESGTSQLIITADLGIAAQYCDRVAVMQGGKIVEINDTRSFFREPQNDYSRNLINSVKL